MLRGQALFPRHQRVNMCRLWERVKWWGTARYHPRMTYAEYHKIGICSTPYWTPIVGKGADHAPRKSSGRSREHTNLAAHALAEVGNNLL